MAGKTFPGMGELEEQSADPADAADSGATPAPSGPFYSGPTVVDDVKVEEGLQKLRALDAPPAAVAGAIDTPWRSSTPTVTRCRLTDNHPRKPAYTRR